MSRARQAPYEAEGSAQELANADALPLLLALLRAAGPAAQAWGLAALLRLLRGSIANLSACDRRAPGRGVARSSVVARRACPSAASACGRGKDGLGWMRRRAVQQRLPMPAAPPGCRVHRAAPPCVTSGPGAGVLALAWSPHRRSVQPEQEGAERTLGLLLKQIKDQDHNIGAPPGEAAAGWA